MHLKIDHQGRLWVLMEDGRVGIFDTKRFKYRDISVKGETGKGKYERGKSIIIDHGVIFIYCSNEKNSISGMRLLSFSQRPFLSYLKRQNGG